MPESSRPLCVHGTGLRSARGRPAAPCLTHGARPFRQSSEHLVQNFQTSCYHLYLPGTGSGLGAMMLSRDGEMDKGTAPRFQGGTSHAYLMARLQRDRPDLAQQV